jgi:hypothetical protein
VVADNADERAGFEFDRAANHSGLVAPNTAPMVVVSAVVVSAVVLKMVVSPLALDPWLLLARLNATITANKGMRARLRTAAASLGTASAIPADARCQPSKLAEASVTRT